MGRFYGLPVEASGMGTDHHVPGIQPGYERALNGMLPMLSWPDILVGPGLLGGSMILSLEQLLIDVEVFRMCKQA
ncbi:MAG: [trimethylamine--corrinoid protein] Co-methyltransferase, partial [Anaerolineae bacterium]|nr:[trimethylamine--corrinoid protein] Co-methyltransferase [Anaerolineae bacterium]